MNLFALLVKLIRRPKKDETFEVIQQAFEEALQFEEGELELPVTRVPTPINRLSHCRYVGCRCGRGYPYKP